MPNSYFNYTNPVKPGTTIQSNKYNNDFFAVQRAFEGLPDPNMLVSNYKTYAVSTGSSTAYLVTLSAFDQSFGYVPGMQVVMRAHLANSGPATLSVNGLPAKEIVNLTVGLGPLTPGDIRRDAIYMLRYDGAKFQLVNSPGSAITNMVAQANMAAVSASQALSSATQASQAASAAAISAQQADMAATQAQAALSSQAFQDAVYQVLKSTSLRVGAIKIFAAGINPNTAFPGTTWAQIPSSITSYIAWRRTV